MAHPDLVTYLTSEYEPLTLVSSDQRILASSANMIGLRVWIAFAQGFCYVTDNRAEFSQNFLLLNDI